MSQLKELLNHISGTYVREVILVIEPGHHMMEESSSRLSTGLRSWTGAETWPWPEAVEQQAQRQTVSFFSFFRPCSYLRICQRTGRNMGIVGVSSDHFTNWPIIIYNKCLP